MKFLIISHALHKIKNSEVFSYAPYVREMNLWLKHVDSVTVIAPRINEPIGVIDTSYKHTKLKFQKIPAIQFTSIIPSLISIIKLPYILFVLFMECLKADHIHLRCPGNIGLLGCLVQVLFPKKFKTAKYAGNWDPNAKQSLSYKFQKWILSNTFLTKNIKVLVYGEWKNQSINIKSFFTATYKKSEIENIFSRDYNDTLNFVFVGSLVSGKRPLLVVEIINELYKKGNKVNLDIFGDGVLKDVLLDYIKENKMEDFVKFYGNQSKGIIKKAYKKAHYSILPSKSEGWPKAIAESMFFGVIPISTEVSCIPYMLDYGKRGVLIKPNLNSALCEIQVHLKDNKQMKLMSNEALKWSQNYTIDVFEKEIFRLLN